MRVTSPPVTPAAEAPSLQPASALRKTFRDGYRASDFRADLAAGTVVGIVALPLSMALAIASGVPPQHGLYTAIVAGATIALFGGSRVQISGPTAAFVVLLAPISAQFGVGGLLLATLMAGGLLMLMGIARLGRLIEFVPYPVTTGFTAGIAVVIATLQVKDLLGLTVESFPPHYLERVGALAAALPTLRAGDLAIGAFTFALLLLWPRLRTKVPAPLVALAAGAVAAAAVARWVPDLAAATLADRFSYVAGGTVHPGIPRSAPMPLLPWAQPGGDGAPVGLSLAMLRQLAPSAFAIAMLGAIESLLSAVVADGMIRRKHDPDAELFAQGLGNVVAPFFGGIAATGAIARTATNVRAGGRSPLAGVVHSLFVLLAMLALAPALGYLPMASLAALLLLVAWNMSEARHVAHTLATAPRSDVVVLLTCFVLTVVFDMVVSVTAGVLLAALLFMKRMSEVSGATLVAEPHRVLERPLPPRTVLYEVAGPLFFGAAHKAMGALHTVASGIDTVILDLRSVPALDATGLVSLDSAVARLTQDGVYVVLAGLQDQPFHALVRAGWRNRPGKTALRRSFTAGLEAADRHAGRAPARA